MDGRETSSPIHTGWHWAAREGATTEVTDRNGAAANRDGLMRFASETKNESHIRRLNNSSQVPKIR